MSCWIYQMTDHDNEEDSWSVEAYRKLAWEGKKRTFSVGKIIARGNPEIDPGDVVLFFFAKGSAEPGICGIGIVKGFDRKTGLCFIPSTPSDFLKIFVCWDKEIEQWLDDIRGNMPRATMWGIHPDEFRRIREKLRAWGH